MATNKQREKNVVPLHVNQMTFFMEIGVEASKALAAIIHNAAYSRMVQRRAQIVYFALVKKRSTKEICSLLDCGKNEVAVNLARYTAEGLDGLLRHSYGTNKSTIDSYRAVILADIAARPVASIEELRERIYTLTHIRRSPTQVRNWAKKQGLKYLRTGQIPAKADIAKQETFKEEVLSPLIEKAENEEIELLFMDASHFVMGTFATFLWAFTRVFIRASAGRKRLNVLGAVNAISKQIHLLTNTDYINANTIVDFLQQLRQAYGDRPLYIVLDNARYQHCDWVRYTAFQLGIHLVFLPPYSPNLNIIERLWKWAKKKCLYARYYPDFASFCHSIIHTLTSANLCNQAELEDLLTLNFQTYRHSNIATMAA